MAEAEEAIVAEIRREQSVGNKIKFADEEFPAQDAALYKDVTALPDYAKVEPRKSQGPHPWLYPHEFASAPMLFKGGSEATDVVQGQLGDCWLLGAMASVANHPDHLLERLFLTPDEDLAECGVVTVQIYKDGEWKPVVIDTRIPYGDPTSQIFNFPIYGRCADPSELWVPLLEKAYAKVHGTYQKLNGGSVAEALVDLTGGVSQKILLTDDHVKELIATGRLWQKLTKLLKKNALIGCSMSVRDGGFEEDAGTGILVNHAYTVLHFKEVGKSLRFVKIRNPWGHGEWRGDWSDGWAGWSDHPDVEAALVDDEACGFRRGEDGVFWMVWEDFVRHFNKVYVCRTFSEDFNQYAVKGSWSGLSAAGAHKVMADRGEEKVADRPRQIVRSDGDPFWFHNPQFRITVNTPGKCFISLMQSDRKLRDTDENASIRFTITAMKRTKKARLWEEDPSEIVADTTQHSFHQAFPQREVSHGNIKLDPSMAYIVVPHTLQPNIETDFLMRVFSTSELTLSALPDPLTIMAKGSWTRESAGGAFSLDSKENATWCLNPQYWLRAASPGDLRTNVTVKVVLQRTDRNAGRDDRSDGLRNTVGIVVTRVPAPPARNPRRRAVGQVRTDALGNPYPVKESTLKRPTATMTASAGAGGGGFDGTATGAGAGAGGDDDGAPSVPNRRLEVRAEEFSQSSDFSDSTVATTLLKVPSEWLKAGLLIHPCLRVPGREGDYSLSVHAEVELEMQELSQSTYKAVTGSWVKGKTAHGCHLNADWKRNPAYVLSAPTAGFSERVMVTLSRPEELWRHQRKADAVGSMIGFYVVTCDDNREAKLNDGRAGLLAETSFVPMHSVSATVDVNFAALRESGKNLLILPATFEPGKEGPFHISVSMESEFDLTLA